MASCQLALELDGDERAFVANGRIRGRVLVRAGAAVETKALAVALGWKTTGKGNTDSREASRVVAFAGTIPQGESSYPFELVAASGPLTYHGKLFDVAWALTASADIPWAIDPTVTQGIALVPGDAPNLIDLGPSRPEVAALAMTEEMRKKVGGCGGAVFALVGAGAAAGAVASKEPGLGVMAVVTLGIAFGLVWFMILRNKIAQAKLGQVTLDVPAGPFHPGQPLPVTVRFTPGARFELTSAKATLVGTEQATTGSGKHKSTARETISTSELVLAEAQTLQAGEPTEWTGTLTLPDDAATTFGATSHEVGWALTVRFDIPNWPDWVDERAVVVVPKGCTPPGRKDG